MYASLYGCQECHLNDCIINPENIIVNIEISDTVEGYAVLGSEVENCRRIILKNSLKNCLIALNEKLFI